MNLLFPFHIKPMITFLLSLVALVAGYFVYGRFVERVFGPDASRLTPAKAHPDGVDYIAMPTWKIFMIQFLNIAGTGPIFGAIMGAKFGVSAYLWIVLGCLFAGAVHDYLCAMISLRHDGAGVPELVGIYLGRRTRALLLVFSVFLLVMVGVVFVYSPATILGHMWGNVTLWVVVIFLYYVVATMTPIDKIIGKVYPLFAFALLFMAVALALCLLCMWPSLPELWHGLQVPAAGVEATGGGHIFPALFITIACGAISGFHATQSPMMARCLGNERLGRPVFYGAMVTEGIVALIWATVAMYFFYNAPTPGYEAIAGAAATGMHTDGPAVVNLVCREWLGLAGGVLAMLGVVAAPITSGDTAFRSARLIVADFLHVSQRKVVARLSISLPLFVGAAVLTLWQIGRPDGFQVVWRYFGWGNQTLAVFVLWMATVYLHRQHKPYWLTFVPALFMTFVCTTFFFVSQQMLGLPYGVGVALGAAVMVVVGMVFLWKCRRGR